MTAICPRCGRECSAHEDFKRGTRWEPSTSLGFSAHCSTCTVSFRAVAPQLAFAVTANTEVA